MPSKKTNAERFLSAYNNIDYTLKSRYDFSRSMGFSDLIRKCVVLNYIVRKNEDKLVDYGRLRNAIVHNNDDFIIAEPHDSVVEDIERLEKLITKMDLSALQMGRRYLTLLGNSCLRVERRMYF